MVRVDSTTNIFSLIRNKDSTIEDFQRLYTIAPTKFDELNEDDNIVDTAVFSKRYDLIDFLKTKSPYYKDEKKLEQLVIENLEANNINFIKLINFKVLKKETNENIVRKLLINYAKDIDRYLYYLYLLFSNPTGEIDINIKIGGLPRIFIFAKSDTPKTVELFKILIEKYKPDLNVKGPDGDTTILHNSINYNTYNIAKLLLDKGAKVDVLKNEYGYLHYIYHQVSDIGNKIKYYKLFLEHGIDPDQIIDKESEYTLLIYSIINNNKQIFDLLIEEGADVNNISRNEYTPLSIACYLDNTIYFIQKLIEKGADVNYISPTVYIQPNKGAAFIIKNVSILQQCIYETHNIDNIKILLESGANKDYRETTTNKTALEIAKHRYKDDKYFYGEIIKLLGGELPEKELWKGFSRSDIEKFDIFFENPYDWSCCPVCLEYIERSEACMYMSHDCATTGHYYNKDLYDDFMYLYGKTKKVEWCTICGRVTELHKHFKLSLAKEQSREKAQLKPEIQEQLDRGDNLAFFDNANCIGFGGGGTEEKAARFRRLREYALELQEDVGKRELDEVMQELIEEVWNAPLIRNRKIKKILENKKWNINVKNFPENKRNNTRNNNTANTPNAANVPFNGRVPTIVDEECIIFREDEPTNTRETNPKFHFHHENVGGMDHDGIYICQKDLSYLVGVKCAEFGLEGFAQCWFSQCKGILHPEELKDIIPEVLYNEYRKKFNKKMARNGGRRGRSTRKIKKQKQRGGNIGKSMLHELKDGTCDPHLWTRDGKLRNLK